MLFRPKWLDWTALTEVNQSNVSRMSAGYFDIYDMGSISYKQPNTQNLVYITSCQLDYFQQKVSNLAKVSSKIEGFILKAPHKVPLFKNGVYHSDVASKNCTYDVRNIILSQSQSQRQHTYRLLIDYLKGQSIITTERVKNCVLGCVNLVPDYLCQPVHAITLNKFVCHFCSRI